VRFRDACWMQTSRNQRGRAEGNHQGYTHLAYECPNVNMHVKVGRLTLQSPPASPRAQAHRNMIQQGMSSPAKATD
jgi:hypothetical protein